MSSTSIASDLAPPPVADRVESSAVGGDGPARRRGVSILALVLLAPTLVQVTVFVLYPLVGNVLVSLTDRRLTRRDAPGVGLENWQSVLTEPDVQRSIRFTVVYSVVVVLATVGLSLSAALALHDRPLLRRFTGNAVVLPIATSLSIAAIGWRLVFGITGPVNQVIELVGVDGPNWLRDPVTAPLVVIVVGVWADTGLLFLLFSAALSRVPTSLVAAAQVYGRWTGIVHKLVLFVPLLSRTIVVATVLAVISSLQSFDQVLLLTDGGPDGVTRTLAFLAWERSFRFFDLGDGAVISMILAGLILVVAAVTAAVLGRALRVTEEPT